MKKICFFIDQMDCDYQLCCCSVKFANVVNLASDFQSSCMFWFYINWVFSICWLFFFLYLYFISLILLDTYARASTRCSETKFFEQTELVGRWRLCWRRVPCKHTNTYIYIYALRTNTRSHSHMGQWHACMRAKESTYNSVVLWPYGFTQGIKCLCNTHSNTTHIHLHRQRHKLASERTRRAAIPSARQREKQLCAMCGVRAYARR